MVYVYVYMHDDIICIDVCYRGHIVLWCMFIVSYELGHIVQLILLYLSLSVYLSVSATCLCAFHGLFVLLCACLSLQVWRLMATTAPPQLMIFELYYGDTLVAADFAHPICGGRTVYVATRFSARGHSKTTVEERGKLEYKNQTEEEEEMAKEMKEEEDDAAIRTMQPGFILALLECRWLQQRGCALWDLGGYNLSPLMQYKLDLAGQPQPRPHGLYEFRNCLLRQSTGAGAGSGAAGAAGVQHPWMESGAGEDGETTDTGAGGAGAGAGAGVGAGDVSAESLFSTVRSGDILIDDVKIEHLLGHSSTL